jgi:thiamine-phosphate pyrophosphorylase
VSAAVAWPLLVVTDRAMASAAGRPLARVVAEAVGAGAPAVLLREKDLAPDARRRLAEGLRRTTATAGAALVVAADGPHDVALAADVGADAVHLSAGAPAPGPTGADAGGVAGALAVGRSCHDEAELAAAAAAGAALVTYSPIATSPSKPGYGPPLGLPALGPARTGLAAASPPAGRPWLLALGGVGPGNARACVDAGADGVAVMGAVMRADRPGAAVHDLLAELLEGSLRG